MKYDLIPLEDAVHFQVFKLATLLTRELTKALKTFELTPERWQILAALWNAEQELSQTKLGEVTLKDKPSVSRLVDSMVEAGWLVRKQDSRDSRAYLVRPSAKANAKREEIIDSLYTHFEPYQHKFGSSAQKELMKLTKAYIAIIEELK